MYRLLLLTATSLALFLACGQSDSAVQHKAISEGLPELRSQFNADAGKVRAIFLAAPT
ncbi:MAG: hypothetical protein ACJ76J_18380 [Thermoanaerobaculia bacterium]